MYGDFQKRITSMEIQNFLIRFDIHMKDKRWYIKEHEKERKGNLAVKVRRKQKLEEKLRTY